MSLRNETLERVESENPCVLSRIRGGKDKKN
jgi:hypothetical protein